MLKAILISLAAGGFTTSAIEYFLKYNLIDLLKDKILGLFGKGKAAVSSEVKAVESDIKAKL